MSKSKRRKKRRTKTKDTTSSGPVFFVQENPFANIPREEIEQGMLEAGRSYEKEFEESLEKLDALICSVDVVHLLSILAAYGLFVGITEAGKARKKESSLNQAHVELAQALVLRIPPSEQSFEPAVPDKVQEIWDLLPKVGRAFDLKRLAQIETTQTAEQKAVLFLQEQLRIHTQLVRNWGFFRKVISITKRLYTPLNRVYEEEVGLGACPRMGDPLFRIQHRVYLLPDWHNIMWSKSRNLYSRTAS